jgi:hypothetical protein
LLPSTRKSYDERTAFNLDHPGICQRWRIYHDYFVGSKVYPMRTLTLKTWMVECIVQTLEEHPYTGAPEIIQSIKEQTKNCWKFKME